MKKIILMLTLTGLTVLTGYSQQTTKMMTTKERDEAKQDSIDYVNFKKENEKKIRENDKKIADFKTSLENEKQEVKDKYNQKIVDAEKKNNELRKKIADYKKDNTKWDQFKREFNHDMDELGNAIKDIFKDNKK